MRPPAALTVFLRLVALLAITAGLSYLSNQAWGEKGEAAPNNAGLVLSETMRVAEFIAANDIPLAVVKEAFDLHAPADLQKSVTSLAPSPQEFTRKIARAMALHQEEAAKNWLKIPLKFGLWLAMLGLVFYLFRRGRLTPAARRWLYPAALLIFGILLGADPNPMGTVKDAIALYGAKGVIFKPRLVALAIFLTGVLIANKFICGWGCQLGVLQDLVFRLNRNRADSRGLLPQYKPPFWVTNTIRVLFFGVFAGVALLWATDIVAPLDPFKMFKPATLSIRGGLFLGVLLAGGLLLYRPWCQLFCPFGLAGWLAEQLSLFKIRVNHDTCSNCGACSAACPSTAMAAILRQERVRPDCFACGTCINVCPTGSINLARGHDQCPAPKPIEHHYFRKPKPKGEPPCTPVD